MRAHVVLAIAIACLLTLTRVSRIAASDDTLLGDSLAPVESVTTTVVETVDAVAETVVVVMDEAPAVVEEVAQPVVTDVTEPVDIDAGEPVVDVVTAPVVEEVTNPVVATVEVVNNPVDETTVVVEDVVATTDEVVNEPILGDGTAPVVEDITDPVDQTFEAAVPNEVTPPTGPAALDDFVTTADDLLAEVGVSTDTGESVDPLVDLSAMPAIEPDSLVSAVTSDFTDEVDSGEVVVVSELLEQVQPTVTDLVELGAGTTQPATQAILPVAEPLIDQVVEATEALAPFIETVEPVVDPLAPVTVPVIELVEPVLNPAIPVTPVVEVDEPVLNPVVPVIQPIENVVDPIFEQIVDPALPITPNPIIPVLPITPNPVPPMAPLPVVPVPVIQVPVITDPDGNQPVVNPTTPAEPTVPVVPPGTRPVLPNKPVAPVRPVESGNVLPASPAGSVNVSTSAGAPAGASANSAVERQAGRTEMTISPRSRVGGWASVPAEGIASVSLVTSQPGDAPLPNAPPPSIPAGGTGTGTSDGSSGTSGKRFGGADAIAALLALLLIASWQAFRRFELRIPQSLHQAILLPPG